MAGDLDSLGVTDDDVRQRYPLIARPAPAQQPVSVRGLTPPASAEPTAPSIAAPKSSPTGPDLAAPTPAIPTATGLAKQTNDDRATQAQLSKGSGISQIGNPWARGALRGLNIAGEIGSAVVPELRPILGSIPGTEEHHQKLLGENTAALTADQDQADKEAQASEAGARTNLANAQATEVPSVIAKNQAEAEAQRAGKVGTDPAAVTLHDLMTGENGQPRINPDTKKPYTYAEAFAHVEQLKQDVKPDKPEKLNDFEQYYHQFLTDNKFPDTAHNRLLAREKFEAAGQAPQRPQQQLVVTPDGTVVEVKPGMKVPQGSKTISGDLAGAKPNAEELKRSEMAENMGENLDKLEEIVKRRPDLFGPLAGRETQAKMWLGSDDPDIGALNTIKDQIGMAQQSAHSMRSAQHVEAAANSILNGFKNGPDAVNNSIKTARDSLKTFTKDVQQGNPSTRKEDTGGATNAPAVGTIVDGYKYNGGDPSDKKNWEQVKK
jgi:hypothetical protein